MSSEDCPLNHTSRYVADGFIWYYFSWYMISANILGIIFSGLCFLVLLKHPRVFAATTRTWFLALTASDFFTLLTAANDMYAEVIFTNTYHAILGRIFGRYTCLIRIITVVCLLWTSNLLQTGLSIERLASVIAPLKTRVVLTGRATRLTIFIIISFSFISGIVINLTTFKPTSSSKYYNLNKTEIVNYEDMVQCERRDVADIFGNTSYVSLDITKLVYNLDLIFFRVIPFITMLICSAVIASLVRIQRRKRSKLVRASSLIQKRNRTLGYNRESRASLLLLTMNVTTLLTNPLFLIFELLDGEGSEGRTAAKLTGDTCISWTLRQYFNSLIYFGNQINWIFYIAFGARFRVHILNMLTCRSRQKSRSGKLLSTHYMTQSGYGHPQASCRIGVVSSNSNNKYQLTKLGCSTAEEDEDEDNYDDNNNNNKINDNINNKRNIISSNKVSTLNLSSDTDNICLKTI